MRLANELADKPRLLKEELSREVRERLPEAIEREARMHEQCFADDAVAARIEERYGE